MIRGFKKSFTTASLTLALLSGAPSPASAQFGGFFGGGLGDIAGILGDILEQAETIANSAEFIVANGEFGQLAPILPELERTLQLLEQADALSFNLKAVLSDFQDVFPEDFKALDLFATVDSINTVSRTTREAIERSLEIGANTVQGQLPAAIRTEIVRAVGTVGGPTAALQALVNLQAEQISQFSQLQTLLVTQSRLLGLEQAKKSNARERSRRLRELDDPTNFIVEDPEPTQFGLDLLN